MSRLPLTLRMLLLVPLVATGVDLARVTLACGPEAQTCLEAAGRGWLGTVAVVLVALYAGAFGLLLARLARRGPQPRGARRGFGRLWLLGSVTVAAACSGQMALASALGGGPAVGGGVLGLVAFSVLAGALLALAMRVATAASRAAAAIAPRAPRPAPSASLPLLLTLCDAAGTALAPAGRPRGRAPPSS